jgi:hypothetical protein
VQSNIFLGVVKNVKYTTVLISAIILFFQTERHIVPPFIDSFHFLQPHHAGLYQGGIRAPIAGGQCTEDRRKDNGTTVAGCGGKHGEGVFELRQGVGQCCFLIK